MNSQLLELGAAKAGAASLHVEQATRATDTHDSPSAPPEADPGKALDQDVLLADRNDLIEADHRRPEEIKTDLTKKERD
jgi:hypothetical protein